ncbi:MAG: low temperature requirement protein A [Deltaproteobacteria bacterium]
MSTVRPPAPPLRHFRPVVLRAADEERHPTWLELFFDLCFVAAVAALASGLHHHPDARGVLTFAGLFVPVWWAWMGYTWYASAFDNDDVVFRVSWFAAMLLVVALASQSGPAADGAGAGFALAYGLLQLLLAALFLRARRRETSARAFATRYATGDLLGAGVWLASALVEPPLQYLLWAAGMAILMATPPLAVLAYRGKAFNAAHVAERYGLFTIIVLGESVVAVAAALGGDTLTWPQVATAALGFGVAACLWWLYFGSVRWSSLTRDSLVRSFTWGYGHLLVFAGVAAAAVGVHLAADAAGDAAEPAAAGRWILAGGVLAFLSALLAVHYVTVLRWDRLATGRAAAAALLAALAAFGGGLGPLAFSGAVFGVLAALTVVETLALGPSPAAEASPQIGG